MTYSTEKKAPNLRSQPQLPIEQEHHEWRAPPPQNIYIPSLRSVPSEPIFVAPITLSKHAPTASDPMSSRGNPIITPSFNPNTYNFNFSSPSNPVLPPSSSLQIAQPPQNTFF